MRTRVSPEYRAWIAMKHRCNTSARYIERGIIVCDKWKFNFRAFLRDVGLKPTSDHSLDRIDNNGIYEPGNVRWATEQVQQNNRSDNVMIGDLTMTEFARKHGKKRATIRQRLKMGWPIEDLTLPNKHTGPPVTALARQHGLTAATLQWRLAAGWTMEEALNTRVGSRTRWSKSLDTDH